MVGSGLFWPDLGLSRIVTITPSSGDRPERQDSADADIFRITLDPGTVDHLRRRAAHRPAAAALSVGARRLQGQDQQLHALPRHRHRHRRPARAVPHHPVRGEGQRDVPGGRGARLGGARLYRHRLRLLGQGVRHVAGRRADLARLGRGDPRRRRCWCSCSPISISTAGTCATRTSRSAGSPVLGALVARRAVRSGDRLGHRAAVARRRRGRSASAWWSISSTHGFDRAVLLIPTWLLLRGLGCRRWSDGHRLRDQRHRRPGAARRPRADRHADRLHGDAARLRRRHHPRHRLRRRAPRAGADRRGRHDLGLGRVGATASTPARRPSTLLGLKRGALEGPAARWLDVLHPLDRDRFRAALDSVLEQRRGRLVQDFRLRTPDGHYHLVRAQGAAGGRLRRRGGAPASARSPT